MKEKVNGIIIRLLTKDKGLHQRFIEGITKKDLEWCEVFESVRGRPPNPEEVICNYTKGFRCCSDHTIEILDTVANYNNNLINDNK